MRNLALLSFFLLAGCGTSKTFIVRDPDKNVKIGEAEVVFGKKKTYSKENGQAKLRLSKKEIKEGVTIIVRNGEIHQPISKTSEELSNDVIDLEGRFFPWKSYNDIDKKAETLFKKIDKANKSIDSLQKDIQGMPDGREKLVFQSRLKIQKDNLMSLENEANLYMDEQDEIVRQGKDIEEIFDIDRIEQVMDIYLGMIDDFRNAIVEIEYYKNTNESTLTDPLKLQFELGKCRFDQLKKTEQDKFINFIERVRKNIELCSMKSPGLILDCTIEGYCDGAFIRDGLVDTLVQYDLPECNVNHESSQDSRNLCLSAVRARQMEQLIRSRLDEFAKNVNYSVIPKGCETGANGKKDASQRRCEITFSSLPKKYWVFD